MYICIIDNTCLCYWYIFSFKYISQWYLHPKLRNGTLLLKCFEVTFIFQRIYYFRPMSSFKIFKCFFRASWVIIHSFFSLISNGCILFYFWHVQGLQETFKTEPNHSNVLIGFPGFFLLNSKSHVLLLIMHEMFALRFYVIYLTLIIRRTYAEQNC